MVEGAGQRVFFGGDTLRIAELDEVARRYPQVDLALLPINGLAIRPAFNRRVVMTAGRGRNRPGGDLSSGAGGTAAGGAASD